MKQAIFRIGLIVLFISDIRCGACSKDDKTAFSDQYKEITGRYLPKELLTACEVVDGTSAAGKFKVAFGGSAGTGNTPGQLFKNIQLTVGTKATKEDWVPQMNTFVTSNSFWRTGFQKCSTQTNFKIANLLKTLNDEFVKLAPSLKIEQAHIEECWASTQLYRIVIFVKDIGACSLTLSVTAPVQINLETRNCYIPFYGPECEKDVSKNTILEKATTTIVGNSEFIQSVSSCKDNKSKTPAEMTVKAQDKQGKAITFVITYKEEHVYGLKVEEDEHYLDNLRATAMTQDCTEEDKDRIEKVVDSVEAQFNFDFDKSNIAFCAKDETHKKYEFTIKKDKAICFGGFEGDDGALTDQRFACFKVDGRLI